MEHPTTGKSHSGVGQTEDQRIEHRLRRTLEFLLDILHSEEVSHDAQPDALQEGNRRQTENRRHEPSPEHRQNEAAVDGTEDAADHEQKEADKINHDCLSGGLVDEEFMQSARRLPAPHFALGDLEFGSNFIHRTHLVGLVGLAQFLSNLLELLLLRHYFFLLSHTEDELKVAANSFLGVSQVGNGTRIGLVFFADRFSMVTGPEESLQKDVVEMTGEYQRYRLRITKIQRVGKDGQAYKNVFHVHVVCCNDSIMRQRMELVDLLLKFRQPLAVYAASAPLHCLAPR